MTQEGNRPTTPRKGMQIGKYIEPRSKSTLVKCRPYGILGATLYVRLAKWAEWEESDPDNPPLFSPREPLIIRRHVGNDTSEDITDFPVRGYRFHADLDEAEIAIERDQVETPEWNFFLVSGYYDGPPLEVYQHIWFKPEDYTFDDPDVVNRYIKLADYTREFRARAWSLAEPIADGWLVFFTPGFSVDTNPATDPLVIQLETVPITAVQNWTPLNPMAFYVAFVPAAATGSYCIFEARG